MVYIDDLIRAASCLLKLAKFKAQMSREFTMKDLGEVHYCLGIHVARDKEKREITLHQKKNIEEVLQRFKMADKQSGRDTHGGGP